MPRAVPLGLARLGDGPTPTLQGLWPCCWVAFLTGESCVGLGAPVPARTRVLVMGVGFSTRTVKAGC